MPACMRIASTSHDSAESYIPESYYSNVTEPRRVGADAAAAAGHESVPHRQLRVAEDVGSGALSAHGEQRVLPGTDDAAAEPDPRVSAAQTANANPCNNALLFNNLPLGVVKAHSLEVTVNRRYSNGLSANLAFSANSVTENRVGRSVRSRADVVAAEPGRAAVPHHRRRGVRAPVRQQQGVPERGRRRRQHPRRMADGRHVRVSAGRDARLGQRRVLQRRPRTTSRRTIRRLPCKRDGTLDQSKYWFNTERLREARRACSRRRSRSARSRSASTTCAAPGSSW